MPANALLGPLVAIITFVCSIGNVLMAAVRWGAGVSFDGVLAFLCADLIVLPLLDVYRRYYGWTMAANIAALFYTTMVLAALTMDASFTTLGLSPHPIPNQQAVMTNVAFNYTFLFEYSLRATGNSSTYNRAHAWETQLTLRLLPTPRL